MSKRDITGKEPYKEIAFRSIKRNPDHYCFIALRTKLSLLDFFVDIFKQSNYLFELSEHSLEIVLNSQNFIFKVFQYNDTGSKQFALCFINKEISKMQYLLGENAENTCFKLLKSKNRNQLSFSFEDEDELQEEQNYKEQYDEQKDWTRFKETMQKKSVDLMGEIDFLFPIQMQTYEILKPFFLEFSNMENIHYRLILPHEIEGVDALITQWDYFQERLIEKEA